MSAYVCLYFLIVCYIIMSKKIQVLRSKIQIFLSRCLPLLFPPVSSSFLLFHFSNSSSIFLLTQYFLFSIIYFSTSLSVVIFLLFLFIFTGISTWLSNLIQQWLTNILVCNSPPALPEIILETLKSNREFVLWNILIFTWWKSYFWITL